MGIGAVTFCSSGSFEASFGVTSSRKKATTSIMTIGFISMSVTRHSSLTRKYLVGWRAVSCRG